MKKKQTLFADNLKTIRHFCKMDCMEFGKLIGVDGKRLSEVEKGRLLPKNTEINAVLREMNPMTKETLLNSLLTLHLQIFPQVTEDPKQISYKMQQIIELADKKTLKETQEHWNPIIDKLKGMFSGSSDYISGVNDGMYEIINHIATPAPVAEQDEHPASNKYCSCGDPSCERFAPVAELPKEAEGKAKELVEKFARYADCNHYEYLGAGRVEIQTSEEKKIKSAKQCALISINREIDLINRLLATNLNNDFDLLRERGELMEVRTAINQI